jgi:hypothetical protein
VTAANPGLVGPPTLNADSTKAYLAGLRFEKSTKPERDSAYLDSTATVRLLTVAEKKAFKIDWPTAMVNRENRGWIVAEIINEDTAEYKPLSLKHGEIAYQWVGPINTDGSDRAVAYYKIDSLTGVASAAMYPIRDITYCNAPRGLSRSKSSAKRQDPYHTDCKSVKYPGALRAVPLYPPDGTWISCVGGCCQVQSPDLTLKKSTKGN